LLVLEEEEPPMTHHFTYPTVRPVEVDRPASPATTTTAQVDPPAKTQRDLVRESLLRCPGAATAGRSR
jgi:hypothetical protein